MATEETRPNSSPNYHDQFLESEARFQMMFDFGMDAMLITDRKGLILHANPAAERLFGWSERELRHMFRTNLIADSEQRLDEFVRRRNPQGFSRVEMNCVRHDGSIFPADISATDFIDPAGREQTSLVIRDITPHRALEAMLRQERDLLSSTMEAVPVAIVVLDSAGRVTYLNANAEMFFGYELKDSIGMDAGKILARIRFTSGQLAIDTVRKVLESRGGIESESMEGIVNLEGSDRHLLGKASVIRTDEDDAPGAILSFMDVSIEREMEMAVEAFLDVNLDMLCVMNREGRFLRVSRRFEQVLGYAAKEMEGKRAFSFIHEEDVPATYSAMNQMLERSEVTGFINRYRCRDGSIRYLEWNAQLARNGSVYASARDITRLREREEHFREISMRDELTLLFNRHHLDGIIQPMQEFADRYQEPLSMMILDLDHFKEVNDTWGHPVGDDLLRATANILAESVRESDVPIRFGGEEFIVLMPHTDQSGGVAAAEKIRHAIEQFQHPVAGHRTASLGVAQRLTAESFQNWYRRTDAALYRAKETGRNRVVISDPGKEPLFSASHLGWRRSYESGNAIIDRQHREILEIANELTRLVLDGAAQYREGESQVRNSASENQDGSSQVRDGAFEIRVYASQSLIGAAVERLRTRILQHFEHEERVLRDVGYPQTENHAAIHRILSARMLRLEQEFRNGEIKPTAFFSFVVDDLVYGHMVQEDAKYYPFIKNMADDSSVME